jgi:hypothetical protein
MIIVLIFILQIALESASDAFLYKSYRPAKFNWRWHSEAYHITKLLYIGCFLLLCYFSAQTIMKWMLFDNYYNLYFNLLFTVFNYSLIRYGIFDILYNWQIGQNINFIGTTWFIDWLLSKFPVLAIWPLRLFLLISAIADLIHLFNA